MTEGDTPDEMYVIHDRRTGAKPSNPWADGPEWSISDEYKPGVEDVPVFEQHAIGPRNYGGIDSE